MKKLLLVMIVLSVPTISASAVHKAVKYVMCKQRKIVRTIRVEKSDGQSCLTKYTKAGTDRVVGRGRNHQACEAFLLNIKGNLEAADWKCKDITSAKISFNSLAE